MRVSKPAIEANNNAVVCVSVAMPFIIMTIMFRPYQRGVYCDDETIRYPYRPDTISHKMMAAVTISCSIIIVNVDEFVSSSDLEKFKPLLFLFGACVSQSLTDMAKYTIGRLRPNFMAVCAPEVCVGYILEINCTGNPRNVTESRLSFYSGHSSFGMYCMLFLALYVQARMASKWARLLRPTIQFFLVAFAIYVGYTRVSDYKHHWSDVVVGLLQGALVAVLTVRYISDFFKERPPRCQDVENAENEDSERKPSLQIVDTDRNHYSYSRPV
uniref:Phospholipid phosphatase 2a n=1 Tax=Cyprinus carpio TaxID=7962 RepID=A0A8C2HXJ6_CYPCA